MTETILAEKPSRPDEKPWGEFIKSDRFLDRLEREIEAQTAPLVETLGRIEGRLARGFAEQKPRAAIERELDGLIEHISGTDHPNRDDVHLALTLWQALMVQPHAATVNEIHTLARTLRGIATELDGLACVADSYELGTLRRKVRALRVQAGNELLGFLPEVG